MPNELIAALADQSEVDRDRVLFREGLDWVAQNPGSFIGLTARRLTYFWWFRPGAGKGQHVATTYPAAWVTWYKLAYGGLLGLAVCGVVLTRGMWMRLLPLYASLAGISVTYSFFFIHTRYRMVLEPVLLLFAGAAMVTIWRLGRDIQRRRVGGSMPGAGSPGS